MMHHAPDSSASHPVPCSFYPVSSSVAIATDFGSPGNHGVALVGATGAPVRPACAAVGLLQLPAAELAPPSACCPWPCPDEAAPLAAMRLCTSHGVGLEPRCRAQARPGPHVWRSGDTGSELDATCTPCLAPTPQWPYQVGWAWNPYALPITWPLTQGYDAGEGVSWCTSTKDESSLKTAGVPPPPPVCSRRRVPNGVSALCCKFIRYPTAQCRSRTSQCSQRRRQSRQSAHDGNRRRSRSEHRPPPSRQARLAFGCFTPSYFLCLERVMCAGACCRRGEGRCSPLAGAVCAGHRASPIQVRRLQLQHGDAGLVDTSPPAA